jgi:two-component system cell cycle sensor histidine kinase/response regulator CckA
LVVEDESAIRGFCLRVLRKRGYRTLEAFDGKMGLAVFLRHQQEVDLVLTDVVMSHSGVAMAEEILRIRPDVSIIFMTSTMNVSQMPEGLKQCRVLEKPFGVEHLSQAVQDSLRVKRRERSRLMKDADLR